MLSQELILELTYWTPLIMLLLSSLGLIALKRTSALPPWAKRLAAPSFYFVSLPIATLIVWIEMLAWIVAWVYALKEVYAGFPMPFRWLDVIFLIWDAPWNDLLQLYPVGILVAVISFVVFCVAPFVSGRMLWRTLRREDERKYPSNRARQHLGTLLLLFVFAWAFLSVRTFVLFVAGDQFPNLRIVCAASCDATLIAARLAKRAVERL